MSTPPQWGKMYPIATRESREFGEFVTALLKLLDAEIITKDEARLALIDWGLRLEGFEELIQQRADKQAKLEDFLSRAAH